MNNSKIFIIAEAGVNHNGSINLAKRMIDIAAESGANAVKFQTFKTEKLVSINAPKADYQKINTSKSESQFAMIKKLELNIDSHLELIDYCKSKSIIFISAPFDLESIDLLVDLGLTIFKIPSGEITNLPYLQKIGQLNMEVILSTGMANLSEIEMALSILINNGTKKENITILHCNTEYPTPFQDVNLLAMNTIKEAFKIKVGYSDHTLGIEVPIAAAALGATIIEKHFTLDKSMDGPDHLASLSPKELEQMVQAIRNIEISLGHGIKAPTPSEIKNIVIARKSIVAASNIKKGEVFNEKNITVKRPGDGISPIRWNEVVGKVAIRDFSIDELIEI